MLIFTLLSLIINFNDMNISMPRFILYLSPALYSFNQKIVLNSQMPIIILKLKFKMQLKAKHEPYFRKSFSCSLLRNSSHSLLRIIYFQFENADSKKTLLESSELEVNCNIEAYLSADNAYFYQKINSFELSHSVNL